MPETGTPYARYSRVTTRRGTLRPLNCPLEPELMVAEFSGELPPDVAQAVREHIAICETCGARAAALRTPYNLLTSLGSEPVPYVPDLRDPVRAKAAAEERWLGPLRALGSISRFSLLAVALGVVVIGVLAFLLRGGLSALGALSISRTTNAITHVVPAAPSGTLLVETNKVLSLGSGIGDSWQVAETLVIDQRTGHVIRSLPSGGSGLSAGSASSLPVDVATDGQVMYELTSAQNGDRQALIAIDVASGATRFVLPLTLPNGAALPTGSQALSFAVAPDHSEIYVSIGGAHGELVGVRTLIVSAAGKVTGALNPATVQVTVLPTPTGSLPSSAFPSQLQWVDLSKMTFTEASHGALVVSPDGQWLFDTLYASNTQGSHYLVVRRIDASTGRTVQSLAMPGSFHNERLAVSPNDGSEELFLVSGSPNAVVYVFDTTATGPSLIGDVALGGPTSTNGAGLTDHLSMSPTADGLRLYITEDTVSSDGSVSAHSRWLVDAQGMSVLASDSELTTVGELLANTSASPQARVFALVNGQIQVGAPDLSSAWSPWLRASDNTAVLRLIATQP
ncbi:MAG TPA: hypothetical protein VF812_06650 [Ktedonobacterales bacterium]